ncbi:hypothetical protein CL616_02350 [archaeon]|nr:hypothetical protein [archaeon]|tara:strand:- start:91 stop:714 length:624 start_codon:yes stop_codon:yes gene_type:complete
MREVSERETTLVQRVINYDNGGAKTFRRLYTLERDTLFYVMNIFKYGPSTVLGVIDDTNVGFLGIDYANGGIIEKRYIISGEELLRFEDPIDLVGRHDNLPDFDRKRDVKAKIREYRQLLDMFHRNWDAWQSFVLNLKKVKFKKRKIAGFLRTDLKIIDNLVTRGAPALLNKESEHPVHDFLMVVDKLYRMDEEAFNELGSSLADLY